MVYFDIENVSKIKLLDIISLVIEALLKNWRPHTKA